MLLQQIFQENNQLVCLLRLLFPAEPAAALPHDEKEETFAADIQSYFLHFLFLRDLEFCRVHFSTRQDRPDNLKQFFSSLM